jgi:hypothetical protein
MQTQILQVAAFMRAFKQDIHLAPVDTVPLETATLRVKLGREKNEEFIASLKLGEVEGHAVVDKAEALDTLCGRLYILLGDAHALGLGLILPAGFRQVHESNMTKLWTAAEADAHHGTDLSFEFLPSPNERCVIARNAFGKVIKSPSYRPAQLQDLIDDIDGQELFSFDAVAKHVFGDAPEPDVDELLDLYGSDDETF